MIGTIIQSTPLSAYSPSQDVVDLTVKVKQDYAEGVRILETPWFELNFRSIIDDENNGKLMFNAFVDESDTEPNEAWKWKGTRSAARNKAIATHAQLTSNYILPLFIAQNENDELDRDFSEIMRDVVEWMCLPTNSNYQASFLQAAFGMMYNPVTYFECDFYEVFMKLSKAYGSQEVLDEVLSGFQTKIYSPTQILISNAYERNIQKQKCIIKRKYVDYAEAEARYGNHPNWVFVQKGIKSIYNEEDGLFYEVKDDGNPTLLMEETYLNRREDLEVCFIGGSYFGDEDVNNNPIRHRDNRHNPKYNIVPFGYSRIGENFFFYKSMMNVLQWDNKRIDAMDEIVYNRGLLEVDMPIAISGVEKIDSDVVFPKSVVSLESPDARIQPLLPASNLVAGFRQLEESQQSLSNSSVDEITEGQLPDASQKVGNVARAQMQARKLLGSVGKNLAESMVQVGDLIKDIAINHITVPQVQELVGGGMKMKYRNILLENQMIGGKMQDKDIKFDPSLIGKKMSKKEKKMRGYAELEKQMTKEGIKDPNKLKKVVYFVNPELFAKFKFLTRIDLEEMFTKNQDYMQPMLTNLYTLLRQDPLIEGEGLLRKLLYSFFQSGGDDLIKDEPMQLPAGAEQMLKTPTKTPNTVMGQQAQNTATARAVESNVNY